jgi:hypothetical protein
MANLRKCPGCCALGPVVADKDQQSDHKTCFVPPVVQTPDQDTLGARRFQCVRCGRWWLASVLGVG